MESSWTTVRRSSQGYGWETNWSWQAHLENTSNILLLKVQRFICFALHQMPNYFAVRIFISNGIHIFMHCFLIHVFATSDFLIEIVYVDFRSVCMCCHLDVWTVENITRYVLCVGCYYFHQWKNMHFSASWSLTCHFYHLRGIKKIDDL